MFIQKEDLPPGSGRVYFCSNCTHLFRNYDTRTLKTKFHIRRMDLWYEELRAYCPECGHEIYVDTINDENVYRRSQSYLQAVKGE